MEVDIKLIDTILEKRSLEQRWLVPSLLDIQSEYNYLPPEALHRVSERM
jgi:NADH:ubiquinone oxidoreductase subunit E